jgi:hypothetical protein
LVCSGSLPFAVGLAPCKLSTVRRYIGNTVETWSQSTNCLLNTRMVAGLMQVQTARKGDSLPCPYPPQGCRVSLSTCYLPLLFGLPLAEMQCAAATPAVSPSGHRVQLAALPPAENVLLLQATQLLWSADRV